MEPLRLLRYRGDHLVPRLVGELVAAGAQEAGAAVDRRDRRAQLVGEHGEELVLGKTRLAQLLQHLLRLLVELGVVEDDARPAREAHGQALVIVVEGARPRVKQEQGPYDLALARAHGNAKEAARQALLRLRRRLGAGRLDREV